MTSGSPEGATSFTPGRRPRVPNAATRDPMTQRTLDRFDLSGRVAAITGGAGLLGRKHAEAIAEAGGRPVLVDLDEARAAAAAAELAREYRTEALGLAADITRPDAVERALARILEAFGRVDILINNA